MNKFISTRQDPVKTIKFSHYYEKFPMVLQPTFLKGLRIKDYSELTEDFIEKDTAIKGGGNYPLPKGKLMILDLWTEGYAWTTVRRWTSEKEKYYRGLIGSEVKIVVEKV